MENYEERQLLEKESAWILKGFDNRKLIEVATRMNYEVRHILGRGSYANVYEGFDKIKQIKVAVKTIEKHQLKLQNLQGRVNQEVAIHIRLEHPSILKLYDTFEDENAVFLILELCPNGHMQRYLDSLGKTLTEDEARGVMHQIVEGLRYLHKNRIVHRDLSLTNLLLTKDMNVKISDFGMAIELEDPDQQHYTLCGTPNFMSPEIASRSAHGKATDVWSLGVILYVCLVGKHPFESTGVRSTLGRVVQGKYELPNTLSPEASDLITRMLCDADGRISLEDIAKHPFMRAKSTSAMMTKKVAEMSMDGGCGTISSTKHSSSSSRSNMYAPSRRTQPMRAFPLQQETHKEEDRVYTNIDSGTSSTRSLTYLSQSSSASVHSHSSSASDQHPPSPPVRERDRMVKLLRDNKPKVTVYTHRAKCLLMENRAFHMEFYDGVTAVSDDKSVIIKEPDGTSLTVSSTELNPRLSSETQELLTYFQQCRDNCLKVEETISPLQALFPGAELITLGRQPGGIESAHRNVRTIYSNKMKVGQKAISDTTTLKSTLSKTPKTTTSTNSSSITSSPGLDRSSGNVHLKTNQGSISDQRKVGDSVILKGSHLSVTASWSLNTAAMTISRQNSSTSSDNGLAHVELCGADQSEASVPRVGWASKNVKEEMEINFQNRTLNLMKTKSYNRLSGNNCE